MADKLTKQVTQYDTKETFSLQPFFKAGTADPAAWIHRTNGEQVSAGMVLSGSDAGVITVSDATDINVTSNSSSNEPKKHIILQSAQTAGIAGTTMYQTNAQLVLVDSGKEELTLGDKTPTRKPN